MAQKVRIELLDDLTGENADETVRFGLDGKEYELDLTSDNATELRDGLEKFIKVARKVTNATSGAHSIRRSGASSNREETQAMRTWLTENGHEINSRGRIPNSLQELYKAAHA